MTLSELISRCDVVSVKGDTSIPVSFATNDSRAACS